MNNNQEINTKICTKCNCEKSFLEYGKEKKGKYGLKSTCKICTKEIYTEYRKEHKEEIKGYSKTYYAKNKNIINERNTNYRSNNKDKCNNLVKKYIINNRDKINLHRRKYKKQRRIKDINYKILCCLRSRLTDALKNNIKSKRTLELLGCSIEEFKSHIELQFKEGMTWDNHGHYTWHIDHIRPCASFDLTDPKQQKMCFHYTNMQPLWWIDNLKKGDRSFYIDGIMEKKLHISNE